MDVTLPVLLAALALQFGCQGAAVRYRSKGKLGGNAYVALENIIKMAFCATQAPLTEFTSLNLLQSVMLAGVPAFVYCLSGVLKVRGYEACDSVTFNVVNQMKILFSAIFGWALFGRTQTPIQMAALALATAAALLISLPGASKGGQAASAPAPASAWSGKLLVLLAALLSAMGAQLCQRALQGQERCPVLFSFELALWGTVFLVPTLKAADVTTLPGTVLRHPGVLVPLVMQSLAGIGVGVLIKTAGAVMMGFSTVLGLCVSVAVEALIEGRPPPTIHILVVPLVCVSIAAYSDPAAAEEALRTIQTVALGALVGDSGGEL